MRKFMIRGRDRCSCMQSGVDSRFTMNSGSMAQQEQEQERKFRLEHHHHLYRLVAFQIGDMQSYVSRLFLFMACEKSSLVFLVDNGPWTADESRSRPAELWQLMVTKSRVSPFANQRLKHRAWIANEAEYSCDMTDSNNKNLREEVFSMGLQSVSLHNWDAILDTLQRRCKALAHSKLLCPQFHGCVAFEVSWGDLRGMNYLNELQTDTCLSLEVKFMKKREFDCLEQALVFYGSECDAVVAGQPEQSAKRNLTENFLEAEIGGSRSKRHCDNEIPPASCTPSNSNSCTEYRVSTPNMTSTTNFAECSSARSETRQTDFSSGRSFQTPNAAVLSDCGLSPVFCSKRRFQSSTHIQDRTGSLTLKPEVGVAHVYRDILVVFRFSDPLLPFELKDIITADQNLLKMLESGLPPWVIFLQSYPILCQMYRPWMRPLARTVYFLVSVVTVMIGFYDLYKNVPVLKATAAHMLGPLFEWIESWEMVSRLKYLGTMLVLQNYEKAFMWVLISIRAVRQLVSLLMRPIMEPVLFLWSFLLPFWATLVEGMQSLALIFGTFFALMLQTTSYILNLILWPFCVFLSALGNLGYAILCPVFSVIRMFFLLPVYAAQYLSELATAFSDDLLDLLRGAWQAVSGTGELVWKAGSPFVSSVQDVKSSRPPSLWRLLWDDLFSKVFRAVRYIINGFVAFFTALNRHRLSIYNNLAAFLIRLIHLLESGHRLVTDTWHRLCQRCTSNPVDENLKED